MSISKHTKEVLADEVHSKKKSIMRETLEDLGKVVKDFEEKLSQKQNKLATD